DRQEDRRAPQGHRASMGPSPLSDGDRTSRTARGSSTARFNGAVASQRRRHGEAATALDADRAGFNGAVASQRRRRHGTAIGERTTTGFNGAVASQRRRRSLYYSGPRKTT